MTYPTFGPSGDGPGDVAPAAPPATVLPEAPPTSRTGGRARQIGAVVATAGVLVLGAGAYAAYAWLNGGGPQPEQVLPASTVAFAKVDLDPAAGQKIAAYRLVKKFPSLSKHATGEGDIKSALLADVFKGDNDFGWTYATDVKPWLGDRIAAAAVPDRTSDSGVDPVLALAYTDAGKMKAAMAKAAAKDKEFGYVVRNHFVLISDSQAHADALVNADEAGTLADAVHFKADRSSLPGDQLALGWVDIGATYGALPSAKRKTLAGLGTPSGRFVVGVHAAADYVEMTGSGREMSGFRGVPSLSAAPGTGMTRALPADTDVAASVTGLGEFLTSLYTKLGESSDGSSLAGGLADEAATVGVHLPGDLGALLGNETLVAVSARTKDDIRVAFRVRTSDPGKAQRIIANVTKGTETLESPVTTVAAPGGYVAGNDVGLVDEVAAGNGGLGSDPRFRKAVPGAATAGLVAYVNLGHLADIGGSAQDKVNFAHLGAFGITATGGPNGTFTVRLTTR